MNSVKNRHDVVLFQVSCDTDSREVAAENRREHFDGYGSPQLPSVDGEPIQEVEAHSHHVAFLEEVNSSLCTSVNSSQRGLP